MKNTNLVLLSVISLLIGCQSPGPKAPTATGASNATTAEEANLTQAEAQARAAAVADVKYKLHIDLDEAADTFGGLAEIRFNLTGSPQNVFLDFTSTATIETATLNGSMFAGNIGDHRIHLPAGDLKAGENVVSVKYKQTYSHKGRGLHKFVDPEDKRVYLHSQFEAFDAHHMFPCFDQPDLKSTMVMSVTAPKTWEVITTTRETAKKADAGKTTWTFPETPKMSTYLFSLCAGPYAKWESRAGEIPLRLFARQSLKKWVRTKDWFTPTISGLKFYGEFFDYPYPFKKYDQIIVPEFNAGAMENIAAVTFTERFIQRGPVTFQDRESLASVILHEMAHMWFGDLVTMKWWNDLWLNESFATYMSALSQDRATEFKDSWELFYAGTKTGAYVEDQLVTTHPISGSVPDLQSAFANFDGITYNKGASVLKQLAYYLGEDAFKTGLHSYFKKHNYSNTEIKDFIGALEAASHKDLAAWSQTWLQTAGVDTLEAEYTCADGQITGFALKVRPPDGQTVARPHRTEVALYSDKGGKITPYKTIGVEYMGPSTPVAELVGEKCPAMVYPNEQDHDYVKVSLDARSVALVKEKLNQIPSAFTRIQFWPILFSMVRDVKLTPQEFLSIVEKNLPGETELAIGRSTARFIGSMIYYLPKATNQEKQARTETVLRMERVLWTKLSSAKSNADWKKVALNTLTGITESEEGRARLLGLLDGSVKVKNLTVDPDQQWDMIIRLMSLGDRRVDPILAKQREKDKSERGENSALAAEASVPALPVKQAWWSRLVDKDDLSLTQKREVMWHFLPETQEDLRQSLGGEFYKQLPVLAKTKDHSFLTMFSRTLVPATCTEASAHKLAEFIGQTSSELPMPVVKSLRITQQEDSRCATIRAHAATATPVRIQ